ncbi:phosphoribosylformylglycinamidine synthase-like [Nilaparvata lugens]|uniref:phosphoribosylformylglycinamidine synthase-like n=1 Tax=Nilaparvata lugens TaxID=108931 RepID=UPI00193D2B54|nr:phosphoribosylformylglycinamidine synthase-like [Nilaparvata lugens]
MIYILLKDHELNDIMAVIHFYRSPGLSHGATLAKLKELKKASSLITGLSTELCFNVELSDPNLSCDDLAKLRWILGSPLDDSALRTESLPRSDLLQSTVIEIGPRLNFSTAFSSNAVSICQAIGLNQVTRLEQSIRYTISWGVQGIEISRSLEQQLLELLYDRMTQMRYLEPISSFDHGIKPDDWFEVDVMKSGRRALEEVNDKLGLAFDDWDLDYYTKVFKDRLKRNPTSVECFDLAQSNSEHSRHWFFKGKMIIDGEAKEGSLIDMIIQTQENSNPNNVIKFSDNSSSIEGFSVNWLQPSSVIQAGQFVEKRSRLNPIFTAETHNFPTAVAPFSGATTGTGGRIRDVQAVGRGGHCIAGTAGYSVGNLNIPEYSLPWEDKSFNYPSNFAKPLDILIEASNGASDYGNKFGEPLILGYTRSFGMIISDDERREWIKPIMFSGGIGVMEADMSDKHKPEKGMKVVKIGGPVYRIGVGGGSASSVQVSTMKNILSSVSRNKRREPWSSEYSACVAALMSRLKAHALPKIRSDSYVGNLRIDDAYYIASAMLLRLFEMNRLIDIRKNGFQYTVLKYGGLKRPASNVLKELVEPCGAVIFSNRFTLGDPSISTLELWGAEYQENNALLIKQDDRSLLSTIAHRERCPINFVGTVTGNGKMILSEEKNANSKKFLDETYYKENVTYPFDLDLDIILGKMPQKVFNLERQAVLLKPVSLPMDIAVEAALDRVLRLPAVSSKRFLTNKVDRCVTGLIAQQQCIGPLHTPLSNVAVTAISMMDTVGVASAIGEQPIKGLIDAAAGARMTVAESLTNLVFAQITTLKDVKCSGNWMWAAKLPGEGAALYEACEAMCKVMSQLNIAVDGGKDSLSMAARVDGKSIKAPGTLVVSTYAPCPDITLTVTPDLKSPARGREGSLLLIDIGCGKVRLGGSALLQCYNQLGNSAPDLDQPVMLVNAFNVMQKLISEKKILAGHDISDGGLVTCLAEMCFGGMSGLKVDLTPRIVEDVSPFQVLFSEELGWVIEVDEGDMNYVQSHFSNAGVHCHNIGKSSGFGMMSKILITHGAKCLVESSVLGLLRMWEDSSYRLECRQANPDCARAEYELLEHRTAPHYNLTFNPDQIFPVEKLMKSKPIVAVIREEGSNGDREMAASLFMAGFDVWDVTMQDLLDKKITVDMFRGLVFPGGFSYADVLDAAKGWAASLLFSCQLAKQFSAFAKRKDTFSLGVCNGCQLMALLGWVGGVQSEPASPGIVLGKNISNRFECRFSTVKIPKSKSIMFDGMEGSVLGVWVAHGEGRFTFKNQNILDKIRDNECCALTYTDDMGTTTEDYPWNPNGSPGGIAGVCSEDGRHLAVMPHPERCTKMWQWPYAPPQWHHQTSPWMKMFTNAYNWCVKNSH